MGATDGELAFKFFVPLKLGRGENNREVRGQRIGRVKAEREALFWAWPRAGAKPAHRGAGLVQHPEVLRVQEVLRVLLPAPLPCMVTFTRMAPGRGLDPEENLPGSCKAIKDEVAAILGADDRDPRVTWRYQQERGDWGVWVHIVAQLPAPEVVAPKRAPKKLKKPRDLTDALLNVEVGRRRASAAAAADRQLAALASPAFVAPRRSP